MSRLHFCSLHKRQNLDKILTYLLGLQGPGHLQVAASPLAVLALVLVGGSVGEEVGFEVSGQGGGGAFGTCVSLLHRLDLDIIITVGDDVAHG